MINAINTAFSGGSPQMVSLKGFRGFTLAEVLITLVIIGVIAAMTIPTLINKTNNQEYVSRLKKAYSILSQATNRIISEQGNPRADIGGWATSAEAIYNQYIKHVSNIKVCENDTSECFVGNYTRMNGVINPLGVGTGNYAFIMPDGIAVLIQESDLSTDCSVPGNGTNNRCMQLVIDLNGQKGPNFVGKDTFGFSLTENGLVPTGCDSNNLCKNTASGWGCTCKAIREGAINY